MAVQNKMDVAISIAIGNAAQVAMFVVSLAILFTLISDGPSNWLGGAMLLELYVLIAIAVWPQDYSDNDNEGMY